MSSPTPAVQARPPSPRRSRSAASLVLSLLVVLGFAFTVVSLTPRPVPDPVRVVDYVAPWDQAAQAADFPVYAPAELPERWRPTSARAAGSPTGTLSWHVGFVTPADQYAAVEQGDGEVAAFLDRVAPGRDQDVVAVAGEEWRRRADAADDRRTLWRADAGSTLAVTGSAQWEELEQLAGALVPR